MYHMQMPQSAAHAIMELRTLRNCENITKSIPETPEKHDSNGGSAPFPPEHGLAFLVKSKLT